MVSPLYWVSALTNAFVLIVILIQEIQMQKKPGKVELAFRKLLLWVIVFCLQDVFWGISAGPQLKSAAALVAASTIFHASTVLTTFFWLNYILTYLGDRIRHRKLYLVLDGVIIAFQAILLLMNFSEPTIFYVGEGIEYCTAYLRPLAFMNQYIVYLVIGICALFAALSEHGDNRKKYWSVVAFAMAPIASGFFQFLYPDGPFYSIGYFLGCFMIHSFVVVRERNELQQLQYEKEKHDSEQKMEAQITLTYMDKLTGIYNRRAYEDDLLNYPSVPVEEDYVYISADVNGLKEINDSKGHAVGDELLKGAADCLMRCLGSYGKVYRLGGDEFAAMIFADPEKLEFIKKDMEETVSKWSSPNIKSMAISFGYVTKRELPGMTVAELAKIADDRMYKAKAAYYMRSGVDRRGQQSAFAALCSSYTKILKINLTSDSYHIIYMDEKEQTEAQGFSLKISEWLHGFANKGGVYKEDLQQYLEKTELTYLKEYFYGNKKSISIFYKRLIRNGFRQAMMEMIPAEDYTDENQSIYLYVKDIEK